MSRLVLMSDLVLRCQRRADREGDTTIATPEWKSLISEQYGHLYSCVVKSGMRYFESTSTITATGATTYSLPADTDSIIGVDRVVNPTTGQTYQLDELMIQERNAFGGTSGDAVAYSIVGQNVVLYPRPLTGTYTLFYVPQSTDISSLPDTSTVDVVTADGEAFLIWGVAVKAIAKLREDPSLAISERNAAEERFVEDVNLRALANPRRRVVMRGGFGGGGPMGGGWGDDGLGWDPGGWWNR